MSSFTHQELVDLTAVKIQRLFGCGMILKECTSSVLNMTPDVFAVKKGGVSFQFEIKTSLNDFLKDKKKPHRKNPQLDVGAYRYYVAPAGIIKPDHNDIINNKAKWGIIEVSKNGRFSFLRGANPTKLKLDFFNTYNEWYNEPNCKAEMELVYSLYMSMVINSQDVSIQVNKIAERLCKDTEQLSEIAKRIR